MFPFRYPAKGYWEAGSKYSAAPLAKLLRKVMNMRGVKVRSDYNFTGMRLKGYDVKLDIGEAVSVEFLDDGAGSTLKIGISNESKESDIFLQIWQNLTNAGFVFDEHFKREADEHFKREADEHFKREAKAQSQEVQPEKMLTESEWSDEQAKLLCSEKIRPEIRLKKIFLFAVLMRHSKITDGTIEMSHHFKWNEVDEWAKTGKTFQELAENFCRTKKKPHPENIVSEIFELRTLINFNDENKRRFEYPKRPKAP